MYLLKCDCEGSEVEIFSSISFKNVAYKIDVIVGENHSWNGRHPNQIREAMKNNGFTYEILPKIQPQDADIFVAVRK